MEVFKVSVKFKLVLVPIARHATTNPDHYRMPFDMIATTIQKTVMLRGSVCESEWKLNNIVRSVILKVEINNKLHLMQLIRLDIHLIYPSISRLKSTRNHIHFRIFKKKLVNIDRRVQEKCA